MNQDPVTEIKKQPHSHDSAIFHLKVALCQSNRPPGKIHMGKDFAKLRSGYFVYYKCDSTSLSSDILNGLGDDDKTWYHCLGIDMTYDQPFWTRFANFLWNVRCFWFDMSSVKGQC